MQGREADLVLLREAAQAAGQLALSYWGKSPRVWDKAGGQGPVSEADLAVDALLRERLMAARPGYGWLSEESPEDPARLAASRLFIVDPIDGTRAFVAGERHFSHALCVVEDGVVQAAVVHLPALGRCYWARAGGGGWCDGAPLQPSAVQDPARAEVLTGKGSLAPHHWQGTPAFRRHFRSSIAYRICLVAEGRFDATLTFRPAWDWDIAAASLIAAEAGAVVSDARGGALVFNRADPRNAGLLVAPGALHGALLAQMRGEEGGPAPSG